MKLNQDYPLECSRKLIEEPNFSPNGEVTESAMNELVKNEVKAIREPCESTIHQEHVNQTQSSAISSILCPQSTVTVHRKTPNSFLPIISLIIRH